MKNFIKGRILLTSLLIVGGVAAVLAIAQIWFDLLTEEYLWKSFTTLAVLGSVVSFLVALDYDLSGSHRKFSLYMLAALVLVLAGVGVYQLWTTAIAAALFGKIIFTLLILIGLFSFAVAAIEDMGENKKLRDEKFID